jgi:pimeloyl-ACP methyl ester carboxylesterase
MSYITTRHGALWYTRLGSGRPLVLIHGNTMTAASQVRLAQRFANEYSVYSIDLLGHGQSARPAELFSTRYFAMQGEALADLLAACFPAARVPIFGMSAGALTALNAACVAAERIAALVLDGVLRYVDAAVVQTNRESLTNISREWDKYMRSQHGDDWWPHLRAGALATMEQLAAAGTDLVPCLEQINIPALIFQGGQDRFCPEPQGRAITAAMPNARLIYDADAGHLLAWKDPDAFRAIAGEFLREHAEG